MKSYLPCRFFAVVLLILAQRTSAVPMPGSPPPTIPISDCPVDSAGGYLWAPVSAGTQATVPCDSASVRFVRQLGPQLKRTCLVNGTWSSADFTGCSVREPSVPFLLIWQVLQTANVSGVISDAPQLEIEVSRILGNLSVPYTTIRMVAAYSVDFGVSVTFDISLNVTEVDKPGTIPRVDTALSALTLSNLATYPVLQQRGNGHIIVTPAYSCQCRLSTNTVVRLCSNAILPPCSCLMGNCQCENIYVGDGNNCTMDSDGDRYPDQPLDSCNNNSNLTYCTKDVCPQVYNPNQNASDCQYIPGYNGCAYDQDPSWSVFWGNTPYGSIEIQRCPNGPGFATRMCQNTGWDSPNFSNCQSFKFGSIESEAMSGLFMPSNMSLDTLLQQAKTITASLLEYSAIQTGPGSSSLLPLDLNLTNYVMRSAIGWLGTSLNSTINSTALPTSNLLDLFNNILHVTNLQGWLQLQEVNSGSQLLLDNAEKYGLYLANAQTSNEQQVVGRLNIVFGVDRVDPANGKNYSFPQSLTQLENFTTSKVFPAQINIPSALISERAQDSTVPVTTILFKNMESVLPLNSPNASIASMVISAQVRQQGGVSSVLKQTPATIQFTFNSSAYDSNAKYRCVYWLSDSDNTKNSSWSTEGLTTTNVTTGDDGMTEVICKSTHLTSFAVLVDVSGSSSSDVNMSNVEIAEFEALNIISYIGCAISILSLAMAVVFFFSLGKTLLTAVNNFIHLNLSISLLLSYVTFAVGVETATTHVGGCIFVATLLHYFLLASFSWMLCEGIMLFLMLVVVFSTMAKKWWGFFILGWGLPLPVVIVSVAVRHSHYGIKDSSGHTIACWLPTSSGVIWAFVGPMLLIIAVNVVFLVATLAIIWKSKKALKKRSGVSKNTLWTLLVATLVLLPLLGLTWVFGLFAVNQNTTVFAWLFTIFNSLQGLFILIFHVLRNDKFHKTSLYKSIARCNKRIKISTDTATKQSRLESKLSEVKIPSDRSLSFSTSCTDGHSDSKDIKE